MDGDPVERAVMTVPFESDFDLSDAGLADSLKQALADSVAEAMAAGGEPARILALRTGSAVEISVLVRDPLPDGSDSVSTVHFFCAHCRLFGCPDHAPRA